MQKSKVAVGFAIVFCGLALALWTRPQQVHVERAARIAVTPETIYPLLVDFGRWPAWTPWRELTRHCSDEHVGPGAWCEGGVGRLSIVRAVPAERVDFELAPRAAVAERAHISVVLVRADASTDVTWSFDATAAFTDAALGMFENVEARLGGDFERALEGLTAAVGAPRQDGTSVPGR